MKKFFIVCMVMVGMLCGCSNSNSSDDLISYMDAKEKIINESAILVDVRTSSEYEEGHLSGAVLLDVDNINEASAKEVIGDIGTEVIVYCKSGARSSQAKKMLENLGYTKVYDLGAMSNWKE